MTPIMPEPDSKQTHQTRIRTLNDQFRNTLMGGRVMVSRGVNALGPAAVAEALSRVRQFEGFDADNDPWGEHDFGAFSVAGQRLFWKIDYYAPDLRGHSLNPAEPAVTVRVLTVMLAGEY